VPILNIDILKCTEEDLSFTSPFRLIAHRTDYVHSFVAYFECAFTQCHKPLGFSTSPQSKYTHWKQTIFYLNESITVCDGEELVGRISCKPNEKNERDLDISLEIEFDGKHSKVDKTVEYRLR
jgi:protein arginine N-methyltransferase 1